MSQTLRAFIAVHVPDQAKRVLLDAVEGLKGQGISGVRWTRPEGIHLTLKFLGNVEEAMVGPILQGIGDAAQGAAPFHLQLGEVGTFPSGSRARVLWVGLEGDLQVLQVLQERVEQQMERLGLPREERGFVPHLTLGRVQERAAGRQRERMGQAIASLNLEEKTAWRVESVSLVRSELHPSGAVYHELGQISL